MAYMRVSPTTAEISGSVAIPPSKYHLHRSLILGSLAQGRSTLYGKSEARHVGFTLGALRAMGSDISPTASGYVVTGREYRVREPQVDVGNSGSTLQFLLGLGALVQNGPVIFHGQRSLMRRPFEPLLNALRTIGISISKTDSGLGLWVHPAKITGGVVMLPGLLSQWASSVLLVAPFAERGVTVILSEPIREQGYVRLTARLMQQFGVEVEGDQNGSCWRVAPGQFYQPTEVQSTPDLSSAAFMLGLAGLHPSRVDLTGFSDDGSEHPEGRILDILQEMGLLLTSDSRRSVLSVRNHGERLRGIEIDMQEIPDLFPILAVLASTAQGTTILRHVQPARYKESDRVAAMMQLRTMGAEIDDQGENVVIRGVPRLRGADLAIADDHRVLMAYAVAATAAEGPTTLSHPWAYRISYPEFRQDLMRLGVDLRIEDRQPKVSLV